MRNGKSTQAALSFLSSFIYLFIHLFIYLFIFLLWTFYGRRCWGSWHGSIFIARHNQRLLKRFFFWGREKKKPEIKMYEIKKMVFFLFLVILGFTLATRSRPVVPLSRWNKLFWKKKERKRWKKMFSEIKKRHHLLASGSLPTVGPPSLPSCTEFFFWLCFFFFIWGGWLRLSAGPGRSMSGRHSFDGIIAVNYSTDGRVAIGFSWSIKASTR